MDTQLRTLRIVRAAMLVAAIMYVFIAERLVQAHDPLPTSFYFAMIAVAAGSALLALIFRNKSVPLGAAAAPLQATDTAKVRRWMVSYIVPYALAESVVLDGLVLRFVGATFPQVLPFYVGGVALLLLLAPRLPEET